MRKFLVGAVAVLAALSLSSCASVPSFDGVTAGKGALANPDTPVGINVRRDPVDLQTVALRQVQGTPCFHVHGTGQYLGQDATLDIHFGKSSGSGRFEFSPGVVANFRFVHNVSYLKGTPGFWKMAMQETPLTNGQMRHFLRLIHGKWIRVGSGAGAAAMSRLGDRRQLFSRSSQPVTSATKGPSSVVNGVRTVSFTIPDSNRTTVFVRADGRPYVVRISGANGRMDFDQWDKPYAAQKPPAKQTLKLPGF